MTYQPINSDDFVSVSNELDRLRYGVSYSGSAYPELAGFLQGCIAFHIAPQEVQSKLDELTNKKREQLAQLKLEKENA